MVKSLGENVAIYDNKVTDLITHIVTDKEAFLNEYKELQHNLPNYDETKRKTLDKLLNTLTFRNKQNEALLKLLEYLNSLEKKDKNIYIRRTLDKMKKIDNEISILNNLIK